MTKAASALLIYLGRYLKEHPERAAALRKLYHEHHNAEMPRVYLWRHTNRKVEPNLSTTIVYFEFLRLEGEFPAASLVYKHRAWLKPEKT